MSLQDWLRASPRGPQPSGHFAVDDVDEHTAPDERTLRLLARLVVEAKSSRDFLREAHAVLAWDVVSTRLEAAEQLAVRRGDFGEILAAGWLEEEKDLRVPVPKLRFQITPEQTQPGTDLLAMRLEGAEITALHFAECKLRTSVDNQTGVAAYEQLQTHRAGNYGQILMFVLERLFERLSPLYGPFLEHLRVRGEDEDTDCFEIALVYDTAAWRETVVEELDDVSGHLQPLTVHAFQIDELAHLVDTAFEAIGVDLIVQDD